ncbi:MAG: cellulase family glycosylhydrolase [Deltaproteobacteria bacterium]
MKTRLTLLAAIVLTMATVPVRAEKPLEDYSFIRGVNYGMYADQAVLERDLGYAKRVNLNSTRIWLNYKAYEKDPQAYIARLRNYIRTAHRMGFSTMPILWNGNGLDPDTLKPEFHARGDAYVKSIVDAVKDEPGLLMWDIMNEPFTNDYHDKASAEEKPQREAEITQFVRYYLTVVKKLDPVNAVTVGYTFSRQLEGSADLVDVLSFHDYTGLRSTVEDAYRVAEEVAKKYHKPILNTETGCIARANPYDMVLQIAQEHKTGWYLFNLIIQGYWGEIHGLFYPDGTVRDPAIIAAVMGFYRNRDLDTIVKPVPNREGQAERALKDLEAALKEDRRIFGHTAPSTDTILDAAERAANLLEAAEMVPMYSPPSAQIIYWRKQPADKRDREAIRKLAYNLGLRLKKYCQLY